MSEVIGRRRQWAAGWPKAPGHGPAARSGCARAADRLRPLAVVPSTLAAVAIAKLLLGEDRVTRFGGGWPRPPDGMGAPGVERSSRLESR